MCITHILESTIASLKEQKIQVELTPINKNTKTEQDFLESLSEHEQLFLVYALPVTNSKEETRWLTAIIHSKTKNSNNSQGVKFDGRSFYFDSMLSIAQVSEANIDKHMDIYLLKVNIMTIPAVEREDPLFPTFFKTNSGIITNDTNMFCLLGGNVRSSLTDTLISELHGKQVRHYNTEQAWANLKWQQISSMECGYKHVVGTQFCVKNNENANKNLLHVAKMSWTMETQE